MRYLLLVAHGEFAPGLHTALNMLEGERDDVLDIPFHDGMSQDDFKAEIRQVIDPITAEDEVLVLADLMGGSPLTGLMEQLDAKLGLGKVRAIGGTQPGEADTLTRVRQLMDCGAFSIKNPNNVYALILAFCNNEPEFHRKDGKGYEFWLQILRELCSVNEYVAARVARTLDHWKRYTPDRAQMMYRVLNEAKHIPGLPVGVQEILDKSLGLTD